MQSELKITLDLSVCDEFEDAAVWAIESGELTEEEAIDTLASFARVVVED